jgi:hypothetical protein
LLNDQLFELWVFPKKKRKDTGNVLGKIIVENFLNLRRDKDIQVQDAQIHFS